MSIPDPAIIGDTAPLQAPFPWFGGKSRVASEVWDAMGDVKNYVEPFFGSGAVYLSSPHPHGVATINDRDGYVCNFWRAVRADPEAVAAIADSPVMENDLHARHAWLVARKGELVARLEGDPDYYDAKIAGWWCWGLCCWIGSGWCASVGPWHAVDGKLINTKQPCGTRRKLPHLGDAGRGINRQLPHLGDAGRGINRQRPHLNFPMAATALANRGHLAEWFIRLADKLGQARVCCGDWTRICGPSPTVKMGLTGVFLDPPYSHGLRDSELYAVETDCAAAVLEWCKTNGDNPLLRIVLAGYAGEHDALESLGWRVQAWKAKGGYGAQGDGRGRDNAHNERIWLSPHCLTAAQRQSRFGFG